jgi:DNA modification methylase
MCLGKTVVGAWKKPYQWRHEPILFGWKKTGKTKWYSDRKQSTVWEFDRPSKSDLHPTMKPVALCAYPIQNSSQSNGIVLDHLVAAAQR